MVLEKILCIKMITYSLKPFNTNIQYTFDMISIFAVTGKVKGKVLEFPQFYPQNL